MSSKVKASDATRGRAALVPERRFPEFCEAGGWENVSLGSVVSISTKKVGDKTCVPMSITSGVGLVSQMEKFGRIIAGDSYKNYLLLQKNDFAYNKSATKEYPEGFIALYNGEELAAVPNSIFTCFRIKGEVASPKYLNYLFLGNLHGQWLRKFIEVGARAHGSLSINNNDLLALPVPVPSGPNSLDEQQKIADCLDSVDALIKAQGRRVEALKAHKKGLMQQLFPHPERVENGIKIPAETQPSRRFPEFDGTGEWAEVPLSKLVRALDAGVSVNSGDRPAMGQEIGVLKTSAVTSGVFEALENKVVFDEDEIKRVKEPVCADTVIISRMNTPALVGANAYVKDDYPTIFLPDRLWAAKPRPGADMRFVALLLGSDRGRAALSGLAGGSSGSMKNISKPSVLELVVMAPSLPEQQHIADCLTSLEDLISAETRKLDMLNTHKKGLMQQLFPQNRGE